MCTNTPLVPPCSQCAAPPSSVPHKAAQIQTHTQCCCPLPVLSLLPPSASLCLSSFLPFTVLFNGRSSKSSYIRVWCSSLWRSGRTRIRSPSPSSRWRSCEISPSTGSRASSTMLMLCTSSRKLFTLQHLSPLLQSTFKIHSRLSFICFVFVNLE